MLNITQYEQLEKAYGKTLREIASDSDSWKGFWIQPDTPTASRSKIRLQCIRRSQE